MIRSLYMVITVMPFATVYSTQSPSGGTPLDGNSLSSMFKGVRKTKMEKGQVVNGPAVRRVGAKNEKGREVSESAVRRVTAQVTAEGEADIALSSEAKWRDANRETARRRAEAKTTKLRRASAKAAPDARNGRAGHDEAFEFAQLKSYRLGSIQIVTVDTKGAGTLHFPGLLGEVENPGHDQLWEGAKTKNDLLLRWLDKAESRHPDSLVILVDSDMTFGGCSEMEIMSRYEKISSASGGAPIVSSAELGFMPYSNSANAKYESKQFRDRLLGALEADDLHDGWVMPYADCRWNSMGPCRNHFVDSSCNLREGYNRMPSNCTISYQYLNYGFTMGPIRHLREMVQFIVDGGGVDGQDQGWAAEYMFGHPDLVSLDYAGTLSLSMHNLEIDKMLADERRGTDGLLETRNVDGRTILFNAATNRTQCFMHGNGNGKQMHKRLVALLSGR